MASLNAHQIRFWRPGASPVTRPFNNELTMDYENKYNEVLAWAKKYKARLNGVPIEEIFPELRESEDERIRRTLVEYFGPKVQLDFVRGVPIQKIRDWLEKQKEQKPELVQHPPITYTYPSDASRDEQLKRAIIALLNSDLIKVAGNKFTKQDLIDWVEKQEDEK